MNTAALRPVIVSLVMLVAPASHGAGLDGSPKPFTGGELARSVAMGFENAASYDVLVDSAINALRLAIKRAEALNYEREKHLIVLTQKEEGRWEVYFKPTGRPKGARGGGLTVHVDEDGLVSRIQRWR